MGLLDQAIGALSGNQAGDNDMLETVMQLVNNPQTGGLGGLVQSFQQGGLGELVNSWVSTGQNLPISADQLQSVLGSPMLQGLAGKFGMSQEQIAGGLASILPQVVDQLTPGGEVPQSGDLMSQGMDLLKGKLFG